MDRARRRAAQQAPLDAAQILRGDALGTVLVTLGAQALRQLGAVSTGGVSTIDGTDGGPGALTTVSAGLSSTSAAPPSPDPGPSVPVQRLDEVDAEAVAEWIVARMPAEPCAAVVIGSPHGAALHLAMAMGAPWLPASFNTTVEFADDDPDQPIVALAHGERLAGPILDMNPEVAVRQVHDPVAHRGRPDGVQLVVRWRQLPQAYEEYLKRYLVPGGSIILIRDVGRWPVVRCGEQFSFQLGSRDNGLEHLPHHGLRDAVRAVDGRVSFDGDLPAFQDADGERGVEGGVVDHARAVALTQGWRLRQVLYRRPEVLSAAVADLHRTWLRHAGRTGNRLVVECGRLVAPWHVLRAGLVPYWCESSLRSAVSAAEWWLAGSDQYSAVEVLPEPPGAGLPAMAELPEWGSVASFASRRGLVDERCAASYPSGTVGPEHARLVLSQYPYDLPFVAPLKPDGALAAMAGAGEVSGLLVL